MIKMRDSRVDWIGEIPNDWETRKIKQIVDYTIENSFVDGDWIESPYVEDSGIRYLTTGNIGDGYFKEQGNGYISLETFSTLNCKYAYPDDLVISRLNSPYGRSCILPSTHDKYVLAVDNVILRPISNKKYLCYVTQCSGYQTSVMENAKGTTMKRISRTNLGNVVIPFPPIEYQNRIANDLDEKCAKIDVIIEKQQDVIEKLKEYKLSIITEAVTKGIISNCNMKDCEIEWVGKMPAHWTKCRLSDVTQRIIVGLATSVTPYYRQEGMVLLRNLNIKEGYLDDNELLYLDTDFAENQTGKFINDGDVLTVHTGSNLGLSCVVPSKYEHTLSFTTLITTPLKEKLLSEYLMYTINSGLGKAEIDKLKCGDIKPNLNVRQFKYFTIFLPPIDEQKQIVLYLEQKLSKIDNSILKKSKEIKKLQEYKKSLIYEVVTGKKEV